MKQILNWPVVLRLSKLIKSSDFIVAIGVLILAAIPAVRPDWAAYVGPVITPAVALGVAWILRSSIKDALTALGSGKPLDQAVATVATDLEQAILPGLPAITPQLIDSIAAAIAKHQQPLVDAIIKAMDSHAALATQVIQAYTPKAGIEPSFLGQLAPPRTTDVHTPQQSDPARAAAADTSPPGNA